MSIESHIKLENSHFSLIRFGSGPKLMLAWPGYGDRKEQFLKLEEALSPHYTVYAIDLPGHGESDWLRPEFYPADILQAVETILHKEQKDKVSLMGHSFGGRVILSILPKLQGRVDEIYLLAPDGLDEGYMRRATFLPRSIRKLLQRLLKHPQWYLGLVAGLNKTGLLNDYSYQFVKLNFANARRRRRLFLFWNSIDTFKLRPAPLRQLLNTTAISVQIILGTQDTIIPGHLWKKWAAGLENGQVAELDTGHRLIGTKLNDWLKAKLSI